MDCNTGIPGQITPKPLFPDGRGELIDVLMPSKICRIESNFLDKLVKKTIKKNRPKIDCKKPQKETGGNNNSKQPLGPIDPNSINTDEVKLWGLTFSGSYYRGEFASLYNSRWEGNLDYLSRIDISNVSQTVSLSQYPNLINHILFTTSTRINYSISSTNEFIGPSSRITGSGSDASVSYVVIDIGTLRQVFPSNLGILYPGTRTVTGDNISAPYFGGYANGDISFFYGSGSQVLDYVNEFNSRPSEEPNYLTVVSYSGRLTIVWSSNILPTADEEIILPGDNGMTNKDDCCCDCVEAVASLMEAYMEKIAPMFEDLKKYIDRRLVEETNEVKKYMDTQLYKQSEFIQKQILELDDQQIDFTSVINQIKTTEQNLWTGSTLKINAEELPKKEENK